MRRYRYLDLNLDSGFDECHHKQQTVVLRIDWGGGGGCWQNRIKYLRQTILSIKTECKYKFNKHNILYKIITFPGYM